MQTLFFEKIVIPLASVSVEQPPSAENVRAQKSATHFIIFYDFVFNSEKNTFTRQEDSYSQRAVPTYYGGYL